MLSLILPIACAVASVALVGGLLLICVKAFDGEAARVEGRPKPA